MNTKKIKISLLVFLLSFSFGLVGLAPLVRATEQDQPKQGSETSNGIYMVVDKNTAKAGEEVTVSIINKTGTPLTSSTFHLSFNNEQFEIIGYQLLGAKPIVHNPNKSEPGHISISKSIDAGNPYTGETVATFTFKVKSDFTGNSNFQIDKAKIGAGATGAGVKKLELTNSSVVVAGQKDPLTNETNSGQEIPKPTDPDTPIKPSANELKPIETEGKATKPTGTSPSIKIVEEEKPKQTTGQPTLENLNRPGQTSDHAGNKKTDPVDPNNRGLNVPANQGGKQLGLGRQEKITQKHVLGRRENSTILKIIERNKTEKTEQARQAGKNNKEEQANRAAAPVAPKPVEVRPSRKLVSQDRQRVNRPTKPEVVTTRSLAESVSESTSETRPSSENSKTIQSSSKKTLHAKQEREFKLTDQETELHNKLVIGGLALITISSAGALAFLIFNNHIKPR